MATRGKAARRVRNELEEVARSMCGISVEVVDDKFTKLRGKISGPPDTPYEGGEYILDIQLPHEYPFKPPEVRFVTKIWHPNIRSSDPTGAICLDVLGKAWTACMSLKAVLLSLQSLLQDPAADDPLDRFVGSQCRDNPEMFKLTAKYWAQVYAGAPRCNADFDDKVERVKAMGLNEETAIMALSTSAWNVRAAVEKIVLRNGQRTDPLMRLLLQQGRQF